MTEQTTKINNKPKRPAINIVLFTITVATVFIAGSDLLNILYYAYARATQPELTLPYIDPMPFLLNGLMYTGGLLAILVCHEAGHYLMAQKHGVKASLPYFIPLPPPFIFGTGGAVIIMKGRIKSRDALMEIGAAGPLAGMAVAIPLTIVGLVFSTIEKIPEMGMFMGESLLFKFLVLIFVDNIPEGFDVALHPLAYAGWVGMLVTMLNLLPIGQLDGGHVFYALFGDKHTKVSRLFHKLIFALGVGIIIHGAIGLPWQLLIQNGLSSENSINAMMAAMGPGLTWFFLGGLLFLMFRKRGYAHPHTDINSLSTQNKWLGITCLIVFILTFMPVVMRPLV